jgi:hypothetical protein
LVGEHSVRALFQFGRCKLLLLEIGSGGTGIVREPAKAAASDDVTVDSGLCDSDL